MNDGTIHPPRERTQRDSALTPLRFGVRTKVSLRADGFVPVLHLQGDVAIAVNALSGMQGVHARSPVYLLAPLPRTRLLFVFRDSQEDDRRLQCAFSWFISSPCECVSAFFYELKAAPACIGLSENKDARFCDGSWFLLFFFL